MNEWGEMNAIAATLDALEHTVCHGYHEFGI